MRAFAITTILLAITAMAQPPKPLNDLTVHKLMASFERALLFQSQALQANAEAQAAANEFDALTKEAVKAEALPEGTHFSIDVKAKTVTPVLPPAKKAEAKAEVKK